MTRLTTRVTKGAALLFGLLALAACSRGEVRTPDEAACARQADQDPKVKELIIKGVGSENFQLQSQAALRAAEQDATAACLRTRGAIPRGGVERQKPLS